MLVLGITGGHDANWCVVRDGVVLGAFEKERFSRKRHARGEVVSLIPETLRRLGLSIDDIDVIATSEPVFRNTESGVRRLAGRVYRELNSWEHQTVEVLGRILPAVSVPHHLAHAAYARYASGYPETAVITWDGGGDRYTEDAFTSTSVSLWKGDRLEWIERVTNADWGSLWYTYARVVFGNPDTAGKLMGLAAFGSGALDDAFCERFATRQIEVFAGATTVKDCWPDYDDPPFVTGRLSWEDQHAKDIAHAVQAVTTRTGLSLAETTRRITGSANLALSGGVALNGYLNTALRASGLFDSVSVPPAVDDGGLSAGCALFVTHHVLGVPYRPDPAFDWAKLGMWYDPEDIRAALAERDDVAYEEIGLDDGVEHAAAELAAGRPVAWVTGRAEHGPRALGSRSIISPASSDDHRKHLNANVKFREMFRPVAPFVTESRAAEYFELDLPSPYMMYIVGCTDRTRSQAPAAVHVDGTARVQTVADDSVLGRIVTAAERNGEPPVLVNTSFNVGEPIVNSPADALNTFTRSPLESMYLDGYLVTRRTDR